MSKTSNPVLKEGLGIVARLVVIAMFLGVLSFVLQGCSGTEETTSVKVTEHAGFEVGMEKSVEKPFLVLN